MIEPGPAGEHAGIYVGDALARLPEIRTGTVQVVVTSPPYYGLRSYLPDGDPRKAMELGSERTPEEYVDKMVAIFREVKRVLHRSGVVWLNIGDAYASGKGTCFNPGGGTNSLGKPAKNAGMHPLDRGTVSTLKQAGLKPKDLLMIPARLALALQSDGADMKAIAVLDRAVNVIYDAYDGQNLPDVALVAIERLMDEYRGAKGNSWYLRSDIIWAKGISFCPTYSGSCMPGSQQDRPTMSHEHVFLLSKERRYYYDNEAVKEPAVRGAAGSTFTNGKTAVNMGDRVSQKEREEDGTRTPRSVWTIDGDLSNFLAYAAMQGVDLDQLVNGFVGGQHWLTDVFAINPGGSDLPHYAMMPTALAEPCIKAGSSERGVCPKCSAPWKRVVERTGGTTGDNLGKRPDNPRAGIRGSGLARPPDGAGTAITRTIGWEPTCRCKMYRLRQDLTEEQRQAILSRLH